MRMRITLNKYEKQIVTERAKEEGAKPWQLMKEMCDFANEEVFKRFFEKEYKKKGIK